MSRDIYEVYENAQAAATDCGLAPGRMLSAIGAAFDLKDDAFGMLARWALLRRILLIKCDIVVDGPWFDLQFCPSTGKLEGSSAWLMPMQKPRATGEDEIVFLDLVAFADEGPRAGGVWRLVGAVDCAGWPAGKSGQRFMTVFTQPKLWLRHWLDQCRDNPNWLSFAETGPDAFATLVLDPARQDWRSHQIEALDTAAFEEIRFADSPELRDLVSRKMQLPELKVPRLRAIKAKPEQEVKNGPPPAAA